MSIEHARAVEKAMTQGDWYGNENDLIGGYCIGTKETTASQSPFACNIADMSVTKADATGIAYMRNAFPYLLDVLQAALVVLEEPIPSPGADIWECSWCGGIAPAHDPIYHREGCPMEILREAVAAVEAVLEEA